MHQLSFINERGTGRMIRQAVPIPLKAKSYHILLEVYCFSSPILQAHANTVGRNRKQGILGILFGKAPNHLAV